MDASSVFKNLSDIVSKAAPLIGTALGGPLGGVAATLVANAFGGSASNPDDLISKINADPEYISKLKQIEYSHGEQMAKYSSMDYENYTKDTQSARNRELEYIKQTGHSDKVMVILAYVVTIGFFATLFILFSQYVDINAEESKVLGVLVGMLSSKWQTIIDYFFGSSKHT